MDKNKKHINNDNNKHSLIEIIFEKFLWNTRFLVMIAVIFSLFSSLVLFVIGSKDIIDIISGLFDYFRGLQNEEFHNFVISKIVGAIDIYLIAVVLLIFSFGLYELFISKIDPAENQETSNILDVNTLDGLKDKIAQVIIMALIIKYFQMLLDMSENFKQPIDMIYLALSILALAVGLFFLQKAKDKKLNIIDK